jgi:cysteinyl-tRNA synthetase
LAWTEDGVEAAERGLERLRAAISDAPNALPRARPEPKVPRSTGESLVKSARDAREKFVVLMDDDLNTAGALGVLHDLAREINRARGEGAAKQDLAPAQGTLKELAGVLGLTLKEPSRAVSEDETVEINALIAERNALRSAKKYAEADKVRARLTEMGVEIADSAQGTTWKKMR